MATQERIVIESMLKVADKTGEIVPFRLNNAQTTIDNALTGRDVIPKARQRGVSTYFLARYLVKCLTRQNVKAVVISHEAEATQRMLQKVHFFIEHMDPSPVIRNMSKNEVTFPKTGSMFYIGTAGAKTFGRGDTVNFLHCSEIAYWPDPKALMGGLMQAVPVRGSEVAIESTGNGIGNYYHRLCTRASEGKSQYRLHFLSWLDEEEYDLRVSPSEAKGILSNLDYSTGEDELIQRYNLTAGQLKFRRMKLEELDGDITLFSQEYPATLDECFQSTGRSVFNKIIYIPTERWQKFDRHLHLLEGHPNPRSKYLIGADVSGGTGNDNSVAQIIELGSMEQVGEWVDNRIEPDVFGQKLNELGRWFNDAFITVEANNHGILTLSVLRDLYKSHLLYYDDKEELPTDNEVRSMRNLGYRTTVTSKPFAIGKLRKLLRDHIVLHSPLTVSELASFVEDETGKLNAEEGCFDDRVIALAMSVVAVERGTLALTDSGSSVLVDYEDRFSLDYIIKELSGRRGGFPISTQVMT